MPKPAIFFDRDDTLIRNRGLPVGPPPAVAGDLVDPELVELLPGVLEACAQLASLGLPMIVVTNQGVIARGGMSLDGLDAIHNRLHDLLSIDGHRLITAIYSCPFHPLGTVEPFNVEHPWRKPQPGMFLAAAQEHDLDLSASWLVGDAPRDIEAALAAGIAPERALLVGDAPGACFAGMPEAAQFIAKRVIAERFIAEQSSSEGAS